MEEVKVMTAHQALLLEMLKDFDAVCRRHHISYQLFAGTALGAVRHHGFIPWDDDVDVILVRSEYDRLLTEAAGDFDPERYYVQRGNSAHWPMQFSKLRRNHTACIEKYHPKDPLVHQGVYIDIFPCDNLSDLPLMRRLQFAASKAIIAKALYRKNERHIHSWRKGRTMKKLKSRLLSILMATVMLFGLLPLAAFADNNGAAGIPNCLYSYYYRTDSTIHSFDVRDISRKLSQEMFSVLSLYMERWGMNDRRHQQLLALYQLRMYLSVYFGVRKSCATARERQILRKYPWGGIEKQWSPYYSEIRCRLSVCERIKLLAAALRL